MAKRDRVAVVGVGYSTVGRHLGLSHRQMAMQAGLAAMEDAGMSPENIDGCTMMANVAGPEPPGLVKVDAMDAAYQLGIGPLNWFSTVDAGPAFVATALTAIAAIQSGFCHTCIAFRVISQRLSGSQGLSVDSMATPVAVPGDNQFTMPFGSTSGIYTIAALPAQLHMERYGTTEEQFGAHVIAQRHHASLNEEAILRTPLTMEDYLNTRYIAKPVRLLDCDYPVDAGSAVIFTTEERAADWKKKPVFVESAAYSSTKYSTFENIDDMNVSSPFHCAETLWSRTDLKPADVDCAQLYDGFTIIVFQWLEAMGFCKPGEAGPFVEAGNTRLGGSLPVNTDGGACNMGRRHGANFCIESVQQLRGECGPRQVPDANVAVWANAVGYFSGAVLMTGE